MCKILRKDGLRKESEFLRARLPHGEYFVYECFTELTLEEFSGYVISRIVCNNYEKTNLSAYNSKAGMQVDLTWTPEKNGVLELKFYEFDEEGNPLLQYIEVMDLQGAF